MSLDHQERQRLVELAQCKVEVDTGTYYPCKQRRIDGWNHFFHRWRGHDHRPEQTAEHFTMRILKEPNSTQIDAMARLRNGVRERHWEPDIVIKAMHDIDVAFFNGKLKGKVIVRWTGPNEEVPGVPTTAAGSTAYHGDGLASIILNSRNILERPDSKMQMWTTLIHEAVVSWA